MEVYEKYRAELYGLLCGVTLEDAKCILKEMVDIGGEHDGFSLIGTMMVHWWWSGFVFGNVLCVSTIVEKLQSWSGQVGDGHRPVLASEDVEKFLESWNISSNRWHFISLSAEMCKIPNKCSVLSVWQQNIPFRLLHLSDKYKLTNMLVTDNPLSETNGAKFDQQKF